MYINFQQNRANLYQPYNGAKKNNKLHEFATAIFFKSTLSDMHHR